MSEVPRVSVVITAYNRETMIADAIESVLAQTMRDFELVVVDDGSSDGTVDVIKSFDDPRIRLIEHEQNRGTAAARNTGLDAARGHYVAWLDSDDTARPRRLKVEADYLDAHPDIALVGSRAGTIKPNGRRSWIPRSRPGRHEEIAATLLFRTPLLFSTVMARREALKRHPYRLEFPVSSDLDQFIRLTRKERVANIPDVLVDRRFHAGQAVKQRADFIFDRKRALFRESLERLGIHPTDEELDRHVILGRIKKQPVDRAFLDWSKAWLDRIMAANREHKVYDPQGLRDAVRGVWRRACLASLLHRDRLYGLAQMLSPPRG